jgi:mRNA-degrading endonuclease HigB of HigAB toxin-antitoxin module
MKCFKACFLPGCKEVDVELPQQNEQTSMNDVQLEIDENKYALLVGINYKGTNAELRGCINDVRNVSQLLIKKGFKEENIKILSEEHDISPTKKNIIKGLIWLLTQKSSSLFFQYSGHGSWLYDIDSDEVDRRDEQLCPLDYKTEGMITDDELRSLLETHTNENTKLFSIIDACHSSTMFDMKYTLKHENSNSFRLETYDYNKMKGDIVLLSGCEDNQTSADAYINLQSQGALTYSFLEVINNDKDLTYETLLQKLFSVIKRKKFTQNPTLSSNISINFDKKVSL